MKSQPFHFGIPTISFYIAATLFYIAAISFYMATIWYYAATTKSHATTQWFCRFGLPFVMWEMSNSCSV